MILSQNALRLARLVSRFSAAPSIFAGSISNVKSLVEISVNDSRTAARSHELACSRIKLAIRRDAIDAERKSEPSWSASVLSTSFSMTAPRKLTVQLVTSITLSSALEIFSISLASLPALSCCAISTARRWSLLSSAVMVERNSASTNESTSECTRRLCSSELAAARMDARLAGGAAAPSEDEEEAEAEDENKADPAAEAEEEEEEEEDESKGATRASSPNSESTAAMSSPAATSSLLETLPAPAPPAPPAPPAATANSAAPSSGVTNSSTKARSRAKLRSRNSLVAAMNSSAPNGTPAARFCSTFETSARRRRSSNEVRLPAAAAGDAPLSMNRY